MLARAVSLVIVASVLASDTRAQAAPAPPFVQLLVDRLDHLAADTAVRRRTGATNGLALVNSAKPDALGQAFVAIAGKLDSAAAVPWVEAFMPLFTASIWEKPIGSRVSDAEARQALTAALAKLSPEDRARVQRAAARTGSDEDTCFFVRMTFASLLGVPGGRAAPVLRTLMFGAGPASRTP